MPKPCFKPAGIIALKHRNI